jgi:hypothetical protein
MKTLIVPRQRDGLDTQNKLPFGMTHPNDTPCPFADDTLPVGFINTCSFNTEVAVETLVSFEEFALASLLKAETDVERMPFVAKELRRAVSRLEVQYVEPTDTPDGPRTGGFLTVVTEKFIPQSRLPFETALTSLLRAADWYEKVGSLGFGVTVWY